MSRKAFLIFLISAVAAAAAILPPGQYQYPGPPRPGTINYVEGTASIGITILNPASAGTVVLEKDQTLATETGKVEILLTPGVFLRVADNSAVTMVSSDLANIRVHVTKGRAMVETLRIMRENDIRIDLNGGSAKVLKEGLYAFDADRGEVRVFKGRAEVDTDNQKITLTDRREVALNAGKPKSQGFEPKDFEDDFYRWSGLRSAYLSEASISAARDYIGRVPTWYGPGWAGVGWYWDPYFGAFTFLPTSGIYYGPFGWGFYSPMAVYYSPFIFYGNVFHRFGEYHYPYGHGFPPPGRWRR